MRRLAPKFFLVQCLIALQLSGQTISWQPTNGPYGGNIRVFAVAPSGTMIAGPDEVRGFFVSRDRGASWSPIVTGATYKIAAGATVSTSGTILLVEGSDVYRSTDDGSSWSKVSSMVNTGRVVFTSNGTTFFACRIPGFGSAEILRSTDNGATWIPAQSGLPTSAGLYALVTNQNGHVFAGSTFNGVYRSTDNGSSWTQINSGLTAFGSTMVLSIVASTNSTLFIGTSAGIYRSTNNGDSWSSSNSGIPSGISASALGVAPNGTIVAAMSDGSIYRSTTSGNGWTKVGNPPGPGGFWNVAFLQTGELFATTDQRGVFRSTDDGTTWQAANSGLRGFVITSLGIAPDGSILAGTHRGTIYRSTDNGTTWSLGDGSYFQAGKTFMVHSSGTIYTAGGGTVLRSTNNGISWSALPSTGSFLGPNVFAAGAGSGVVINNLGTLFGSVYGLGLYQSTNGGTSWNKVSAVTDPYIHSLIMHTNGSIFLGAGGVWRSTDGGTTWSKLTALPNVNTYTIAGRTDGSIFVGTLGSGVFRSTNNGESWTAVSNGIPTTGNNIVNNISSIAFNSSGIYLATQSGVYRSTNNGDSWTTVNSGLPSSPAELICYSIVSKPSGELFVATADGRVYRTGALTAVAHQETVVPSTFSLSQNYPNPFNPSTTIAFDIPSAGVVSLTVFDLLGRQVTTLVNDHLQPGQYQTTWNATGMPSGVYLYRLQAGGFVQTRKLILQK